MRQEDLRWTLDKKLGHFSSLIESAYLLWASVKCASMAHPARHDTANAHVMHPRLWHTGRAKAHLSDLEVPFFKSVMYFRVKTWCVAQASTVACSETSAQARRIIVVTAKHSRRKSMLLPVEEAVCHRRRTR